MAYTFSFDGSHLPPLVEEPRPQYSKPTTLRVGKVEIEDWSHLPLPQRCTCPDPSSPAFKSEVHGLLAPPKITYHKVL